MNTAMGEKPHSVDLKPFGMFSAPEARADGALLDDLHRRGERARAQQQREVVGLRSSCGR